MFKMGGTVQKTFTSVMADFNRVRDDLLEVSAERAAKIEGLEIVKADIERGISENRTEMEQCDRTVDKFNEFLGI